MLIRGHIQTSKRTHALSNILLKQALVLTAFFPAQSYATISFTDYPLSYVSSDNQEYRQDEQLEADQQEQRDRQQAARRAAQERQQREQEQLQEQQRQQAEAQQRAYQQQQEAERQRQYEQQQYEQQQRQQAVEQERAREQEQYERQRQQEEYQRQQYERQQAQQQERQREADLQEQRERQLENQRARQQEQYEQERQRQIEFERREEEQRQAQQRQIELQRQEQERMQEQRRLEQERVQAEQEQQAQMERQRQQAEQQRIEEQRQAQQRQIELQRQEQERMQAEQEQKAARAQEQQREADRLAEERQRQADLLRQQEQDRVEQIRRDQQLDEEKRQLELQRQEQERQAASINSKQTFGDSNQSPQPSQTGFSVGTQPPEPTPPNPVSGSNQSQGQDTGIQGPIVRSNPQPVQPASVRDTIQQGVAGPIYGNGSEGSGQPQGPANPFQSPQDTQATRFAGSTPAAYAELLSASDIALNNQLPVGNAQRIENQFSVSQVRQIAQNGQIAGWRESTREALNGLNGSRKSQVITTASGAGAQNTGSPSSNPSATNNTQCGQITRYQQSIIEGYHGLPQQTGVAKPSISTLCRWQQDGSLDRRLNQFQIEINAVANSGPNRPSSERHRLAMEAVRSSPEVRKAINQLYEDIVKLYAGNTTTKLLTSKEKFAVDMLIYIDGGIKNVSDNKKESSIILRSASNINYVASFMLDQITNYYLGKIGLNIPASGLLNLSGAAIGVYSYTYFGGN